MSRSPALRMMDEMLVEAKAAARAKVAAELKEMMRERLPQIFSRLKRDSSPGAVNGKPTPDSIKAEIRAVMAQAVIEDRTFAAGFFLQRIADEHFHTFIYDAVVSETDKSSGIVDIADTVEAVLKACERGRESYPEIAKPRLPRRCDVSKLVRRWCIRPWKVDENRRTVWRERRRNK